MVYLIEVIDKRILSSNVISGTLTEVINRILSQKYTRPILESLDKEPSGLSFRVIDVRIIGERGSPSSASKTLKKLTDAGWIEVKGNAYCITENGLRALDYARQGDAISSAITGRI